MASLATIRTGDIVRVEIKGRRTLALVTDKRPRELAIRAINDQTFTWHTATSRQVLEHWRKTKNIARSTNGEP